MCGKQGVDMSKERHFGLRARSPPLLADQPESCRFYSHLIQQESVRFCDSSLAGRTATNAG